MSLHAAAFRLPSVSHILSCRAISEWGYLKISDDGTSAWEDEIGANAEMLVGGEYDAAASKDMSKVECLAQ